MTFSSRRKLRTILRAPTRCARTAISLAAGWLLAAGAATAQSQGLALPLFTAKDSPFPAPVKAEMLPKTRPAGAEAPTVQTVTFTRQPVGAIQSTAEAMSQGQAAGRPRLGGDGDVEGLIISTELPGLDRLTERKSEAQVFEWWRLEAHTRPGAQRLVFPDSTPGPRETYAGRNFKSEHVATVEPTFIVHRKLLFEQPNFDRHGWELGALQPGVSTARFFYDVAMMPYHNWTNPLQHWDSSAGKCLPGDNTPLLRYREQFSVTGLAAQTGAVFLGVVGW